MYNKFLEQVYIQKFEQSDDVKSLGWGSLTSQQKRFKILIEIGIDSNDSVLDVGCGYGDISPNFKNYLGVDLRESAIEKARIKYPMNNFECLDIQQIDNNFDWVISSGIFCFTKNWKKITSQTIEKMVSISNKGVAVNFLSDLTKGKREIGMKYTNPKEVIKIVENISSKFTIRHDYLPNDFTLYIYK